MELHTEIDYSPSKPMTFMNNGVKNSSKTCVQRIVHGKDNASSPCHKSKGKTMSLSAQFFVGIDELVNNVTERAAGNFDADDEESNRGDSTLLRRASSYPSSQIAARILPSEHDILDVVKLDRIPGDGVAVAQEEDIDLSCQWKKTHIKPTLPICLEFQDVEYKVAVKGLKGLEAEKYILHGVTGSVHPGELLALMGPSGGGKTTLLNLLSARIKFDSGTITYNYRPYTKSLKKRIGYVMQDDIVFPHLTVKETLTYAALLRLPNTLTPDQKKERATSVISELGLDRCQNTIIGGKLMRGVSGGERKRVCIGNEILLNPSLLFLDEPTSGLDSTAALRIVQMLRNVAKAGKTVVTTIHQPSSRVFSKFDKLILLGKGNSLYSGKASEAMLYFSSIGCSPLIAMNPAEFLIDLANGNISNKSFPSQWESDKCLPEQTQGLTGTGGGLSPVDVHEYLVEAYEARAANSKKGNILECVKVESKVETQRKFTKPIETEANWWQQFSILLQRGLKERRHEYLSWMRITQVLSTAIIIGLLWCHSNAPSPQQLQDQAGLLFFVSVFWGFFPLFTAIFTFPQERAMLIKERSVDMYKLSAYFAARNISDLPLDFVLPIIFIVIVYLIVGLRASFTAFSLTTLTVFLNIVASQGLGLTIGAAFMDVKKATTLASLIVMTFMLSGGFFIKKVPPFMSWVRFISFNYHTYRLLLKIQYNCSGSDHGSDICKSDFIGELRLDQGELEVGSLIAMIVGYRLLAYLFLKRMKLN